MKEEQQKIILVTGASGLVGSALQYEVNSQKLNNEKYIFLSSKDADLTNKEETLKVFNKYKPTHVVNLAARAGGLYMHLKNNLDFYIINTNINQNVLSCSYETGVKKCVSCLSTCVFPDKTTYPIDETMIHSGPPHESNFGYAYAKRMVDIQNKAYFDKHGAIYTSVAPTNIFGPNDNFDLNDSHVIAGLIHKCYIAKRDNTPFKISGTGKALRQFVYSRDLAKFFLWALREYNEIETIIFSVDEKDEISIKELVDTIVECMDFKGEIIYDTSKSDGQIKKTANNNKLKKYCPDFKFTPFKQAMKETCEWFISNYDTLLRK